MCMYVIKLKPIDVYLQQKTTQVISIALMYIHTCIGICIRHTEDPWHIPFPNY